MRTQRPKVKATPLLKLDLGCGQNKQPGYLGVDIAAAPGVDKVFDLFTFPFPFKSAQVEAIYASHFFEHIPQNLRFQFMDECYRLLVPGGKMAIICPYYSSVRAVQDPTHQWPPIAEWTFLYFNKGWREQNKLDHYPVKCDFDFTYGYAFYPQWAGRSEEQRQFAIQHHINVVSDIHVELTKRA